MRLPQDLSGEDLARALAVFGHTLQRQAGGHLRLTTQGHGEDYLTIPKHESLRVGTVAPSTRRGRQGVGARPRLPGLRGQRGSEDRLWG